MATRRCARTSRPARRIWWSGCTATRPAQAAKREMAELLHQIEHADGWNLETRIKADAPSPWRAAAGCARRAAFRRRKTPGGALPRAGGPAGPAAAG